MLLNVVLKREPSVLAPAIIAMATTAAIKPYSRAVTPLRSFLRDVHDLTNFVIINPFCSVPLGSCSHLTAHFSSRSSLNYANFTDSTIKEVRETVVQL